VFGAKACLEALRDHPLYAERDALPDDEGIGIALGWWPGGYEPAAAVCRLDSDGQLTVITGAADMTGVETSFAAIAAEELEIAPEDLEIVGGEIRPAGVPAKAIAIDELAPKILRFGSLYPPVEGHGRVA
jgi:CO/xanthine dehydrogenase Mo-binding subunit